MGNSTVAADYELQEYEKTVVNSALWSAAGDALGWMTELSRGTGGVKHRTGTEFVVEPVAWKRLIGGRSGVTVDLPAGTYSDDTQLRLCVSRAIRGNGAFDVEAFAKIEVTVWQGYCLGAGIGSKAAASNLSKRGVNWFSNFFKTDRQRYTNAGGNGAAMRIQPHVWSSQANAAEMVGRVLRDSLVTHGHPHGFCGAVFHALCLWNTIQKRRIPTLDEARGFLDSISRLTNLVMEDSELSSFWLPTWEREAETDLPSALNQFCREAIRDFNTIERMFQHNKNTSYHDVLNELGCLTDRFRGSGFKTALAALIQSQLHENGKIEDALIEAVNELESDTDTIATMIGALLGSVCERSPEWKIQDRHYIQEEALRMARIAFKQVQNSFQYPDISEWTPPSNQSDSIVMFDGSLALVGFGLGSPKSKDYASGGSVWQWFEIFDSQTILAKRRANSIAKASITQFPSKKNKKGVLEMSKKDMSSVQEGFHFEGQRTTDGGAVDRHASQRKVAYSSFQGLDAATLEVISSGFDDATLGRLLNQCIEETGSIEMAVSMSAIIAKAKLARNRRK
ncbi:ADP-ribosylglycohydrolase family protein [Sulfitobacter sp.]|uniref:ADP-ribosylglycohydrolase family protein n=1 Tax=Sulfitobacter sp. TaxID=1903071 RepID=UPI003EF10218